MPLLGDCSAGLLARQRDEKQTERAMRNPPTRSNAARPGDLLLTLLLVLAVPSCSSSRDGNRKPVHPVRGQVFVQGKPAVGAFVLFVPVNEPAEPKDPRPRATVEADGSFVVSTYGANDGAPAGEYVVTITWPGGTTPDGKEEPEDKLLGRYSNPVKSKLSATVKEGPNEIPPYRLK